MWLKQRELGREVEEKVTGQWGQERDLLLHCPGDTFPDLHEGVGASLAHPQCPCIPVTAPTGPLQLGLPTSGWATTAHLYPERATEPGTYEVMMVAPLAGLGEWALFLGHQRCCLPHFPQANGWCLLLRVSHLKCFR